MNELRLMAFLRGRLDQPRVRHLVGIPASVGRRRSTESDLPMPSILTIEPGEAGSVFLHRLTENGVECGDTWHQSVRDAKDQARYEYGDSVSDWEEIPADVANPRQFAVNAFRSRCGKSTG